MFNYVFARQTKYICSTCYPHQLLIEYLNPFNNLNSREITNNQNSSKKYV